MEVVAVTLPRTAWEALHALVVQEALKQAKEGNKAETWQMLNRFAPVMGVASQSEHVHQTEQMVRNLAGIHTDRSVYEKLAPLVQVVPEPEHAEGLEVIGE